MYSQEKDHAVRRTGIAFGLLAATAVVTFAAAPAPAHAQGSAACEQAQQGKKKGLFGSRFARLASAAGVAAVTGRRASASAAADAAARDVIENGRERAQAEAAAAVACNANGETASTAVSTVAPAQAATLQPAVASSSFSRPGDMPIAPEIQAQIDAFDEFGKVDCSECEGGYAYDSWAQLAFASELRGEYGGWEKKLGALEPGQSLEWQGAANAGTLTVSAREQVSGFDCKRLTYRLTRGSESAERPGLLCWGKSSPYAGSDSWVEVF